MNRPSKAELESQPPRRGSTSPDTENPLMKLVDAANMLHSNTSDRTASCNSNTSQKTSTATVSCGSSVSSGDDAKSVGSNEGKVMKGTRADLFDSSNRKATFAEQLMDILDDEKNHDVLSWMPDGESFCIVNHRLFAMERMHKLFKIRNMSSFVRKLTRWGFNRIHEKTTRNSDIFKHKLFQKGRKDLVKKIRCVYRPALKPDPTPTPMPAVISPVTQGRNVNPQDGNTLAMPYSSAHSQPVFRSTSSASFQACSPPRHSRVVSHEEHLVRSPGLEAQMMTPLSSPMYRPRPTYLSRMGSEPALGDVTSQVVSAAIETLRRDQRQHHVAAAAHLHHHHQQQQHELMSLRSAHNMMGQPQQHPGPFRSSGVPPPTPFELSAAQAAHRRASFHQQPSQLPLSYPRSPAGRAWVPRGDGNNYAHFQ